MDNKIVLILDRKRTLKAQTSNAFLNLLVCNITKIVENRPPTKFEPSVFWNDIWERILIFWRRVSPLFPHHNTYLLLYNPDMNWF